VRRLLKKCLEKDPKRRLRDIGDAWELLEGPGKTVPASLKTSLGFGALAWAVAVVALALAAWGWWRATRPAEEARVFKMSVLPPEKVVLLGDIPAVSPDGRRIAFAASVDGNASLWVRDLGSLQAHALPGTDGAGLPFWSPDSRFLGFFANGKLKRTDAAGGSVLNLCDAPVGRGGTWNRKDVIVFAAGLTSALFRVPAAGGTPALVTSLNGQEPGHRYPWFLPDGRHFLYTAYGRNVASNTVYVQDLDTNSRHALIRASSNVVYASGYLLFLKELSLVAQPFDAGKLQTTGDAVPVAEQLGYTALDLRAYFSSSQNGVLVYDSPTSSGFGGAAGYSQLTWFDRSGKITGTVGPPGGLIGVAISRNGDSVATSRLDPQTGIADIWLYDLVRATNSRFTFNALANVGPVWSPDDSHIAFFSDGGATNGVHEKTTNGVGQDDLLEKTPPIMAPVDWSKDGRYIIERSGLDAKTTAIWVLPLFGDKKPFPYLQTDANEPWAKLSPNGQWLAYESDETKRNEIYVTAFPQPSGKLQISTAGGSYPVWSRDGKELYYIAADAMMMAVEVRAGPKFDAGVPRPLFKTHAVETNLGAIYDVSKDGRFLIQAPVEQTGTTPITVEVNWQAELKK
jgi:Tol biopolymer transport system component